MFSFFPFLYGCFCFLFLPVISCPWAKPPLSPSFHPHSFVSDICSVQGGCSRFSRCCYLIIDLSYHRFGESRAPGISRSHPDTASMLSYVDTKLAEPPPTSLPTYYPMILPPHRLPTND